MISDDVYQLDRFLKSQETIYHTALNELRAGRKQTHWMWFVFPQLRGLGCSLISQHFGIRSLDEARAYLSDSVLGARLRESTQMTLDIEGRSARDIFGFPDDLKFRSSMTLFCEAALPSDTVFQDALNHYFDGVKDEATLVLLGDF